MSTDSNGETEIQKHLSSPRPAECTRHRLKPFISGCGCTWCVRSDDFQRAYSFLETLYISNRLALPLKGIILIGY